MSENEKKKTDNQPLKVNVGDPIRVTDISDVTVVESDLTVIVPGPGGEGQRLIIEEGCFSDAVAESVREAVDIPSDASGWPGFQELIEETTEKVREQGPEVTINLPVPTGLLKSMGIPWEIPPVFQFIGHKKETVTTVRSHKLEKPKGSSS